jgi:hypothetical protein
VLFLAKRFGYRIVELPAEILNKAFGTVSFRSYLQVLKEVAEVVGNRILWRYPRRPETHLSSVSAKSPR